MGHEYLEMKNTNAAIESYRTAVDIDQKDFRAWYGLGQAYELNSLYSYAAYYYFSAASAKPHDSRMWAALAHCFEKMEKNVEAIKCTQWADRVKDKEAFAMHKLAKLYQTTGDVQKAAHYFLENLNRKGQETSNSAETVEAYVFLSRYYRDLKQYE